MSEAFHESQNGHHERVKGFFTRTSTLNREPGTLNLSSYNLYMKIKACKKMHKDDIEGHENNYYA
jgi:hypothetical protein